MIRLAIFDCDGTPVDSQANVRTATEAYSSPSPDGEGNHAKHGGGVISAGLGKIPLHHPTGGPPPHASRREELE
ncbi:MAG TPA: hypothetical protein VF680_06230 [Allosphingosinicella sp.]|jgi:predicted outer membrane repeat protein